MDPIAFEHLAALNRSVEAAIDTLCKLAEYPELQKRESFMASRSYFRELLADANVSILEALRGAEERAGGAACKERLAYEKLVRDPDDCYLEVLQRVKERQQQGLPPMIGVHFGTRNLVVDEIKVEAEADSSGPETDASGDADEADGAIEADDEGEKRRQRIVARVEALRTGRTMTNHELSSLIGLSAADSWREYVKHKGNEGWKHATPQMFEKIAQVFGIDSIVLLQ
jgi:hypothetical protein